MIKIDRCPVPPESLAVEAKKVYGSYNEPDVVRQLKMDSNDKCYICELGGLSDPEVEHLKPHYNRKLKDRVFDWDNLFYVCPHCNKIKKDSKYDEKIIDCCQCDPEMALDQGFKDGHVYVHNITDDESDIMTADLIQNCFEKRNTGIREMACQRRINELSRTMDVLYKTLKRYKENPDTVRYQKSLSSMLDRRSEFAAFKRSYVRKHLDDYPRLEEFLV